MQKQYYETVDVRTGSLPLSPTDRTISEIVPVITNGDDCIQSAYYNFSFRHWANLSGELLDVTHWLRPVNLSNEKELYQWVKASERLPEKHGVYHLRKPSKDTNGWHGWYSFVPIKSAIDKDVWVMEQWEWLEKVNLSNHDKESGVLFLNQNEFEHLPDKSVYNNNYYKHTGLGYIIYEKCQDDYNERSYYLIEDGTQIFIGDSCNSGFGDGEGVVKINFKQYFT